MGQHVGLERTRELVGAAGELFPVRVVRKFLDHGGGSQSALIAWNALTAVFPIVLALAAIAGAFLSAFGITPEAIAQQLVAVFPKDVAAQDAAMSALVTLQSKTELFAILALIGFVWTASGLFGAMEEAFGVVFQTPGRPFVRQKLMALGMMGLFVVLTVLAVATSALVPLLDGLPVLPFSLTHGLTATVFPVGVGVVSGFVLFFAIYMIVPNRRQRVSRVWPGALFAGVAFELLTLLFPVYINLNRGINQFGSQFAFLFILLAFFYFLGVITMLGAAMIAVLDPPPPPR